MICLAQEEAWAGGEDIPAIELEQMMSSVALYPDVLLMQVLIATSYPDDVAEAVIWSRNNPGKQGDAALSVIQNRYWDLSVISLLAFPKVLAMMGRQPEWVQKTGDVYIENPRAVMDAVQKLRWKAKWANKQKVSEQRENIGSADLTETITIIEPTDDKVAYLPPYSPTIIYAPAWSPYYRPGYYGNYYWPRFYNPDFRSWYYRPYRYGYGYGYRYWAW